MIDPAIDLLERRRRRIVGASGDYASLMRSWQATLWYRHKETGGTLMQNSGVLGPDPIPLPTAAPTNPPVTPPMACPPLGSDMDMEVGDTSAWTNPNSPVTTLSKQTGTPHGGLRCLRVATNGTGTGIARQTILVVGRVYRVSGYARSDGVCSPAINEGVVLVWTGTTAQTWQSFDVVFVAGSINFQLLALNPGTSQYVEFDDVRLAEYIPAYNLLKDGDQEAINTGAWTAGNSATLSKSTTTPHGGSRCLRVARSTVNNPDAAQSVLVTGRVYHLTGWARSDGNASPRIADTVVPIIWAGTTSTDWQPIDVIFVAGAANLLLYAITSTGTQYVEWDDLILTEYYPAWFSVGADMDMEAVNTSAWTAGSSATLSKQDASPRSGKCLRVARSTVNNPYAYQSICVIGRVYHLTGYARSDGNATPRIWSDAGGSVLWDGTTSTSWQPIDIRFANSGIPLLFAAITSTGNQYVEFDDLCLTMAQPTALLQDGDMEVADVNAWTVVNSATLSKQIGTPHSGARCLRIARNGVDYPGASQTVLIVGRTYRITGYARSDGNAIPQVAASGVAVFTGTTSTEWQSVNSVFTPLTTGIFAVQATGSGTQYAEFDDLVLTEVATGSTAPLGSDMDMEAVGIAAWTALNGATLTKETGTPHGGSRVLRIAYGTLPNPVARQSGILTVGVAYRLTGYARGDGSAAPYIQNNSVDKWSGTSSASWQSFDLVFVAAATEISLLALTAGVGYVEFDDLTLHESFGDGTYTAMTLAQTGRLGPNEAVLTDALTSLATIPANKFGSCKAFTLMFLCKATNAGEANNGTLLYWGSVNNIVRIAGATGTLTASRQAATTSAATTTSDVIPFGQWIVVFVTYCDYGDRVLHIYLGYKGVVSEMIATTKTPCAGALTDLSANAMTLYNYADASKTFAGLPDEFPGIPRVLTLAEMQRVLALTGV